MSNHHPPPGNQMLSAIVGFEIEVIDLLAKFKLSQNRPLDDQRGVIEQLNKADDENSQSIATLMKDNLN